MDIGSSAYKQMSHHPSLFDSEFANAKSELIFVGPTLKGSAVPLSSTGSGNKMPEPV